MDIHKPKPWHGSRELLKEIGTIVIGVLIALAAEQGVEWLHWRHVVSEEREALNSEVAGLRAAMQGRIDIEPCIAGRLDEIRTVIARHDAGAPLGLVGTTVGRPIYATASTATWDMAVADQSLSHMPLAEKQNYLAAYSNFRTYMEIANDERASWRSMQALNHASALTANDWSQLRKDLDQAAEARTIMKASLVAGRAGYWLTPFERFPAPKTVFPLRTLPTVAALCSPMIIH